MISLIDTHTHFDDALFAVDREHQALLAAQAGVEHLLLVGYVRRYFSRLFAVQAQINQSPNSLASPLPHAHVALGLHPFYIHEHQDSDVTQLAQLLTNTGSQTAQTSTVPSTVAIGEIGLDTFTAQMKQVQVYARQQALFIAQLDLAVEHQLPVLLHIRKAHADALKILQSHDYDAHVLGGIAHSFSGGEQEAKAFVRLGFKLGVTGQVCNPNAKKLHRAILAAVAEYGLSSLVIETDCPDMLPAYAEQTHSTGTIQHGRNTPSHLPFVLQGLSELLAVDGEELAVQLWHNSRQALPTLPPLPTLPASTLF